MSNQNGSWEWPANYPPQGPGNQTPQGLGNYPPSNYGQSYEGWNQGPYATEPKPPVVPFRPLNIGDLFEGTFAAIRSNPKVMFTFSLVTMAIVGVIAGIANAFVFENLPAWADGFDPTALDPGASPMMTLPTLSLQLIVSVLQSAAAMLITGMLVLSVTNAVVGLNNDTTSTWQQLRPRFWNLVGTTLLVGLIIGAIATIGVIGIVVVVVAISSAVGDSGLFLGILVLVLVPVFIAAIIWLSVRLYFATMCTVVEDVSPTQALGRSWQLTKGAFWRVLGRVALMILVVGAASSILSGAVTTVVLGLLSFLDAPWLIGLVSTLLGALVSGLVQPVTAAFSSLMYIDERVRKEDLAPRLQAALDANRQAPTPEAQRPPL